MPGVYSWLKATDYRDVAEDLSFLMIGSSVEHYTYIPWAICAFYELVALVLVVIRVLKYRRHGGGDAPVLDL